MHPIISHFHDAWHRRHAHRPHGHDGRHDHGGCHGTGRGARGFGGFAGFGHHAGFGGLLHAGMEGLRRGRKLGSADLQLLLLKLLADRPSHGYELIKALEERSNGYYSPSPGMVYPALTYLEEIGYASVESDGAKKLYSVTVAGLAHLEDRRAQVEALLEQLSVIGSRMDQLRQAMDRAGDDGDDRSASDFDPRGRGQGARHDRRAGGSPAMRTARRNLKAALVAKIDADADEQVRVAAILERAAAEIRGGRDGQR